MSTSNSKKAVYASFFANIGVGVSKFIAFLITGSSSMLAESVHSVADSSNQLLLLLGGRHSKKAPSKSHPFGYGRVHFLYAFMVAIILFSLGGMFAIYEGISKVNNPHALENPAVAYVVLIVAILLEGFALRTALREAKEFKPTHQSWWQFLRHTKSVNHVVLTLEDTSALLGLFMAAVGITLSLLTDNPIWDGISTLMIGALLIIVAAILFIEVKSLLIGEAVDQETEDKMLQIILSIEEVDKVVDLKTLYIGPYELFIAMKITVGEEDDAKTIAVAIDEIEARLRAEYPIAKLIYVEPDLFKTRKQQIASDKRIAKSIK